MQFGIFFKKFEECKKQYRLLALTVYMWWHFNDILGRSSLYQITDQMICKNPSVKGWGPTYPSGAFSFEEHQSTTVFLQYYY